MEWIGIGMEHKWNGYGITRMKWNGMVYGKD